MLPKFFLPFTIQINYSSNPNNFEKNLTFSLKFQKFFSHLYNFCHSRIEQFGNKIPLLTFALHLKDSRMRSSNFEIQDWNKFELDYWDRLHWLKRTGQHSLRWVWSFFVSPISVAHWRLPTCNSIIKKI